MPLTLPLSASDVAVMRRGHPWLFHGARYGALRRAAPGDVVELTDPDGRFVARGLADPVPPIGVRVLTRDPAERLDAALLARRLRAARDLRARFLDLSRTTAYRLVNGEGDGLPGLVVDRYGAHAAVQCYSRAWHPWLPAIVEGLLSAVPFEGIVSRDRVRRAPLLKGEAPPEGGESSLTVLHGERPPENLIVREHGVRFLASLDHGQKTGLYLDQRDNRQRVQAFARGADVLNTFSYTGGFGLYAALAGAARVTNVDVSKKAQAAAAQNFELNGCEPAAHRFVTEDVFDYLARESRRGHAYDVVICDPPSFATTRKGVFSALKGYCRLAESALRVTKPGGVLVAASCTAQVTADQFWSALRDGAADAGASLQCVAAHGLPADHPVPLAFPEGRYLKFVVAVRAGGAR